MPKVIAVLLAAAVIISTAFTGSFRRFERVAMTLCAGSLLLLPLYLLSHPSGARMAAGFAVPELPGNGAGGMAAVMLLVIGIVGTTVSRRGNCSSSQSYVIDKRASPRAFIRYEGRPVDRHRDRRPRRRGHHGRPSPPRSTTSRTSPDVAGIIHAIAAHSGARSVRQLFAVALLDASVIGAFAVSLATAYAVSDVTGKNHSLHRGVGQARGFYALYAALIGGAAATVLILAPPPASSPRGCRSCAGCCCPSRPCSCSCCYGDHTRCWNFPWAIGPQDQRSLPRRGHRAADHLLSVVLTGLECCSRPSPPPDPR